MLRRIHRVAGTAVFAAIGCGGLVTWDPSDALTTDEPTSPSGQAGAASEPAEPCESGSARWCEGPASCPGAQFCRSTGQWSPCFCFPDAPRQEPCDIAVRRCANTCGAGAQRCVDGLWQPCNAFDERTCHNGCAAGVEYCVIDGWLPCDAPAQQPCSNGCADGVQQCIDGEWAGCDAPTERTCTNDCGTGHQLCVDETWTTCDASGQQACSTFCGPGTRNCEDGTWGPCSAHEPVWPVFTATVRDFHESHPDMERPGWGSFQPGLVLPQLGADDKPVYSGIFYDRIDGATTFDQWYRDVPDVNVPTTIEIPLDLVATAPEVFRFSNPAFFPIDGQLFGNEGQSHNFHFTLELVTRFRYAGGEVFSFSGDDDLWVFINERLAIDLGGEHVELSASVELDAAAADLEIVPGGEYPLHLFFAERHTLESHFTIETTINDWDACP